MLRILVVDDDEDLRQALSGVLREQGYTVESAADGEAAVSCLATQAFHLVISDVRIPKLDGLALLRHIRREFPATKVLLMTAYATIGDAVTAIKHQALDYLPKPFNLDTLVTVVEGIDELRRLQEAHAHARLDGAERVRLVGHCPQILRLVDRIDAIADTSASVLLTGESGTGKELVARMLHETSGRRAAPLVVVNCAAVPPGLIEAELFGHERGAFTGAVKKREGLFAVANGGTLLLDEIGEMPLEAQAKLLRVLQEGELVPVGSNRSLRVDVRLVSATNRDLKAMVAAGHFRQDLYYRIKVFELHLPPLRERRGDLPRLVEQFLSEFGGADGAAPELSPAAWAALRDYPFPGNVRELRHAIQHASILSRGAEIDLPHLPPEISGRPGSSDGIRAHSLAESMEEYERELITRTIRGAGDKRRRAAELLGISRKSLWKKLTKYGLQHRRGPDAQG